MVENNFTSWLPLLCSLHFPIFENFLFVIYYIIDYILYIIDYLLYGLNYHPVDYPDGWKQFHLLAAAPEDKLPLGSGRLLLQWARQNNQMYHCSFHLLFTFHSFQFLSKIKKNRFTTDASSFDKQILFMIVMFPFPCQTCEPFIFPQSFRCLKYFPLFMSGLVCHSLKRNYINFILLQIFTV